MIDEHDFVADGTDVVPFPGWGFEPEDAAGGAATVAHEDVVVAVAIHVESEEAHGPADLLKQRACPCLEVAWVLTGGEELEDCTRELAAGEDMDAGIAFEFERESVDPAQVLAGFGDGFGLPVWRPVCVDAGGLAFFAGADYVREAVREKNERALKDRMVFLSKTLSAQHLAENLAMDGSAADGLD